MEDHREARGRAEEKPGPWPGSTQPGHAFAQRGRLSRPTKCRANAETSIRHRKRRRVARPDDAREYRRWHRALAQPTSKPEASANSRAAPWRAIIPRAAAGGPGLRWFPVCRLFD